MSMIGVPEITLIVPTLCVGMPPRTLRVRPCDAAQQISDGHKKTRIAAGFFNA